MPKRKTVLTGFLATPQGRDPLISSAVAPEVADRKTRASKPIQQTLYLPPAVHDQLRTLAFHRRVKMHAIVLEGLDMVFQERGLKAINELSSDC